MRILAAINAFMFVWGAIFTTAGLQIRDPSVVLFGGSICSLTAAALVWIAV